MSKHRAVTENQRPEASPLLQTATVYHLNINDIALNQDQPRKTFDDRTLHELADSIRQHGVIQPIIVTKQGLHYRLVAGERRWRASRIAGQTTIPAIVRELSDRDVMQQALIENIQREDLNPMEESRAYHRLLQDYRLTQEQLAEVVGKSRSTVANSLRLTQLSDEAQDLLNDGRITAGHARAILSVGTDRLQNAFAEAIVREGLSVRTSEKRAKTFREDYEKAELKRAQAVDVRAGETPEPITAAEGQRQLLETALRQHFERKVRVDMEDADLCRGKMTLGFESLEDMEALLEQLGINPETLG